jgi:large subunit ribosomal protein L9
MQIILKTDIAGLGFKNDTVEVKPGYGRNYLIPQGFAVMATDSNKKVVAENIRQAAHKAEKTKNDALAIAEAISELPLKILAKAGESGKIFGRVTNTQVADALKDKEVSTSTGRKSPSTKPKFWVHTTPSSTCTRT